MFCIWVLIAFASLATKKSLGDDAQACKFGTICGEIGYTYCI